MRGSGFAATKAGYALACMVSALVIVVAGLAHEVTGLTSALGMGAGLGGGPSTGAMNILVMGLESRTDFQGRILDVHQLNITHSGSRAAVAAGRQGSQDTDTLILIHVFDGGKKAAGFSIPRDDVVNYPYEVYPNGTSSQGYTEGKIDAAYAYAYSQSLAQTINTTMSRQQRYLEANQAGQLFQIQTIESVTGVHIDHFALSNIIGFYTLAQLFGGLEVCIKPAPAQGGFAAGANLTDRTGYSDNSGFDAYADGYSRQKGGKQYLHLNAAQSLAYIRSRDTLPGIDVGRTARQQAAIDFIVWKLENGGVLTDIGKITSLMSAAKGYLMYDSTWKIIDFAQAMRTFSGTGLRFATLPEISTNGVSLPGYGGTQSADYIDVPQIQRQVNQAFYGRSAVPSPAPGETVDVYNGSSTAGLAGLVSRDLADMGYTAGAVKDAADQSQKVQPQTQVFYGPGGADLANAQAIANVMGIQVPTSLPSLPAGHVEVLLGSSVNDQAPGLEMFGADSVSPSAYVTAGQQNGQSVSASAQAAVAAAATAGISGDVPAYSEKNAAAPAAAASAAATPSAEAGGSGTAASTPVAPAKKSLSGASGSSGKSSSGNASRSGGSPSNPNPPYGLTSCPY